MDGQLRVYCICYRNHTRTHEQKRGGASESLEPIQMEVVWVLVVAAEDEAACYSAVTGHAQLQVVLRERCQVLPQDVGFPGQ